MASLSVQIASVVNGAPVMADFRELRVQMRFEEGA